MRGLLRVVLPVVLLAACGPKGREGDDQSDDAMGIDAPAQIDGPVTQFDAPPIGDTSKVYAHTADKLYRLNNVTFQTMEIGTLTGLGGDSLLDLAVDKDDRMLGTTADNVYSINPATAACTLLKALPTAAKGASSLSFIPQATGDDILVTANVNGDVYQINPTTGTATKVGNYGTGTNGAITSSGDLFGVMGFGPTGIYATVNVGTDRNANDVLATIDPAHNWKATLMPNDTGFNNIFGLGFWDGHIYGFVDNGGTLGTGSIIEIDPTSGVGTMKTPGTVRWYGAAVATDAPIVGRTAP